MLVLDTFWLRILLFLSDTDPVFLRFGKDIKKNDAGFVLNAQSQNHIIKEKRNVLTVFNIFEIKRIGDIFKVRSDYVSGSATLLLCVLN